MQNGPRAVTILPCSFNFVFWSVRGYHSALEARYLKNGLLFRPGPFRHHVSRNPRTTLIGDWAILGKPAHSKKRLRGLRSGYLGFYYIPSRSPVLHLIDHGKETRLFTMYPCHYGSSAKSLNTSRPPIDTYVTSASIVHSTLRISHYSPQPYALPLSPIHSCYNIPTLKP